MPQPDAAVAILRTPAPTESVLLMRRAERAGDPWSGHWSFPGGRREPADPDLAQTALRELSEECGIALGTERIESALPPVLARRRVGRFLLVAPFVFRVDCEMPVILDPREAVQAVWVPLSILADPARHRLGPVPGMPECMLFPSIDLDGMPLWGFTYRLITEWLGLLSGGAASGQAVAEGLLELLLEHGLKLKKNWTGQGAAVEGVIPVGKVIQSLSTPSGRIPPVNVVEVRPEQIRIAGLAFEEYFIEGSVRSSRG
jgi:8-oxo-dGTP diphosphatase